MLRLSDIVKKYKVADTEVSALKGISISFRKNEFVSILGPSGCGKTTTLNIIGGLDKYTSGDLFIAGRSTKDFSDRDWDVYRNHRVGFVFQAYNLIPHQTILGNVELALTIAGISKEERTRRAKETIDRVGLKGLYNKKPNQLSGGQCQRVAIARALVNEPEILLADEPTGALDSETSIQIMDLIKEISKEKLVIMVTHNPELAVKYSTRIVKLLDGEVLEDSNPFSEEDEIQECKEAKEAEAQLEKAKMSMTTATKLSFKNLLSKKKRSIMTIIAGSIGIIGVATVLSVSRGVKDYIADMQDDMLSGNPIQIAKSGIDYNTIFNASSTSQKVEALKKQEGKINVNSVVAYLCSNKDALQSLVYNNEFTMDYVNYVKSMPEEYYADINLNYGIDLTSSVYTDFKLERNYPNTKYDRSMSIAAITSNYTATIENMEEYKQYASTITGLASPLSQGVSSNKYIESQYNLLSGNLPKDSHDVLVVLDSKSSITDLNLAMLGYYSQDEFFDLVYKGLGTDSYDESLYKNQFTYEEILSKKFTWYPNDVIYSKMPSGYQMNGVNVPFVYNYEEDSSWQGGVSLNVCGIVQPKDNVSYGALSSGFIYTEDFAREVISKNIQSEIAAYIRVNGSIGMDLVSKVYSMVPYMLDFYFEDKANTRLSTVGSMDQMTAIMQYFSQASSASSYMTSVSLNNVGGTYLPESINIYPVDFNTKDNVTNYLDEWNDSTKPVVFNAYSEDFKTINGQKTAYATGRLEIKYTDSVGLIIDMINTMINIITWALVAFTALSLVVSTVMVGIITYVSVVERTKEIGVIRSLGGRKKDVSHLFNAETFMIGLSSGVFGIVFTGILSIIINIIVNIASDGQVSSMSHLTITTAIVMVIVSVLLTLISGFIPARAAAKRNPVDALRSE